MSLTDEARDLVRKPGIRCFLHKLHDDDPELAAEIDEALASDLPTSAITAALAVRGIRLERQVLPRHRRQECSWCR